MENDFSRLARDSGGTRRSGLPPRYGFHVKSVKTYTRRFLTDAYVFSQGAVMRGGEDEDEQLRARRSR